jgi:2-iminobutanoate/2-iminopropanoate deaminase
MPGPDIVKLNPAGLHRPVDNLYSHVVSATGGTLHRIGGMVAVDADGHNIAAGDMAGQIKSVYEQVSLALAAVGATWANVIHLYTFTTDMDSYLEAERQIAPAYLGERPPASTLIQVPRLVDKDWLVEVQADAVT